MRELTVTLETVTPLFLGGADGRTPELRPPSVRGMLRYWLRASLGGVMGDQNLKALKTAESEVFGSTEGAGAIAVYLQQYPDLTHEMMNPLPHKNSPTRFDGFLAQQRFSITLTQQQDVGGVWLSAISSLLLLVAFGGVGRRSRRGWGTLRIVKARAQKAGLKDPWPALLQVQPQSAEEWQFYRLQTSNAAKSATKALCRKLQISSQSPNHPAAFPVLDLTNATWVCEHIYPTSKAAIEEFGKREHEFGVAKAFGSADKPRWASPLWVRVLPVTQPTRGYVLAMTLLQSQCEVADYASIRKFIREKWDPLPEVKL